MHHSLSVFFVLGTTLFCPHTRNPVHLNNLENGCKRPGKDEFTDIKSAESEFFISFSCFFVRLCENIKNNLICRENVSKVVQSQHEWPREK